MKINIYTGVSGIKIIKISLSPPSHFLSPSLPIPPHPHPPLPLPPHPPSISALPCPFHILIPILLPPPSFPLYLAPSLPYPLHCLILFVPSANSYLANITNMTKTLLINLCIFWLIFNLFFTRVFFPLYKEII